MAALALEIEHGVDHVLDHARAGDLAVLGDMADEDDRGAGLLGVADQRLRGGAHLGDRARRRIGEVGPQRLDGIDDDERRRLVGGERRQDVLDAGLGGELAPALRSAPGARRAAGSAPPPPRRRHRRPAGRLGQRAGRLQQQRRLADAGIAADQQRRAAHEAAAGHAVELGDAGADARRVVGARRRARSAPRRGPCRACAPRGPAATPPPALSSTSVFHSPQSSHLPCQRELTAPQFWQANEVFRRTTDDRATRRSPRMFSLCSHGFEAKARRRERLFADSQQTPFMPAPELAPRRDVPRAQCFLCLRYRSFGANTPLPSVLSFSAALAACEAKAGSPPRKGGGEQGAGPPPDGRAVVWASSPPLCGRDREGGMRTPPPSRRGTASRSRALFAPGHEPFEELPLPEGRRGWRAPGECRAVTPQELRALA